MKKFSATILLVVAVFATVMAGATSSSVSSPATASFEAESPGKGKG